MDKKQENEIISNDEVNIYDYWKILMKRKKIFLSIFLVPLVIVMIVSLILPRHYRGESPITNPVLPAPNIVNLIGTIDDIKKIKIFANNSSAIKSVLISLPQKTTDKVNIIVVAKTADIIPQAFKDISDYLSNLPEIKEETARIQAIVDLDTERIMEETDFKIKKLVEVKEANLIFLNDVLDMIKKKKLPVININPADLVKKDGDLALEIIHLQQAKTDMIKKKELNIKMTRGILGPPTLTKQPSDSEIKQRIIITGILSLLTGIFIVFFLDYIERMKARENK